MDGPIWPSVAVKKVGDKSMPFELVPHLIMTACMFMVGILSGQIVPWDAYWNRMDVNTYVDGGKKYRATEGLYHYGELANTHPIMGVGKEGEAT